MKTILSVFSFFVAISISFAQIPPLAFNYSAVARNPQGNPIANTTIGIQISILKTSTVGPIQYQENHFVNTDAFGLFNLVVGSGAVQQGSMASIDWSLDNYYLKIGMDADGGTNFLTMGTTQLLSVPYALFAAEAGTTNGTINETDPIWTSSSANYYTKSEMQTSGLSQMHFNNITYKPNTVQEYGITNAVDTSSNQSIGGTKSFSKDILVNGLTLGRGNNNFIDNVAIGHEALKFNTTGVMNTATGQGALLFNTTGNENSAFGWFSLAQNTTGYGNTAIGDSALGNCTSGSFNTAIGSRAIQGGYSGSSNTAVGYNSLSQNIWGNGNTIIGGSSMINSASSSYNTSLGFSTFYQNLTGSYNTVIGSYSDVGYSNLTNATAIGNGAIVNASNKIRLGNGAVTVIEGQVPFTNASDIRLKKNIKDINHGLGFILKLRPVEYQMIKDGESINFGFIAQDVERLLGTNNNILTIGGDADRTLGLRYTDFIAPMVKAIQEQQKEIQEQKKEIEALKQMVYSMLNK